VEPREQLFHLVKIQDLARRIQADRSVIKESPDRIEEIEGRFRERNTEYVEVKGRFDALEKDIRERNLELESLQVNRKKFSSDLMQVQNQREYSAILKEIDEVKSKISDHEEVILTNMEEVEKLKGDLESMGEHIKIEREKVGVEVAGVQAAVKASEEELTTSLAERATLEGEIPGILSGSIRRVEASRRGVFLVEVVDGTCQACYVRVRPQVYQEIKAASKVHACGSCRRYLYHDASVQAMLATEVETVNDSQA
jgi:predicted  nucleic acid-binding Zn-ribbon protein